MIGQPSVNDLASMFMGNPGPLQAKANQDQQQQKQGLPSDLRNLLALQIVTNEGDAAKRNAAMQQLQQMGTQGPQGEPPTVAQSLQQQAKQKLQAQMVQQMRQQQGLQGLMQQMPPGAVPEQTPQPAEQPEPQGLDQLQSNVGENYAGGGIIAFNGEEDSEVPEARPLRYESAQDRAEEYIRRKMAARAQEAADARRIEELAATIPGQNVQAPQGGERAASTETERNIANMLSALPGAGAVKGFAGGARGILGLLGGLLGGDQGNQPAAPAAPAASAEPQPRPGVRPTMAQDPRLLTTDQGQGIAASERVGSNVGRPPVGAPGRVAPAMVAAPAAPAAPAAQSPREKFLAAAYDTTPEAAAAKARQDYETQVGQRSTADLAALADEIAARRQAMRERADPLMDFLQGVAMAPRGEKWMQSGVRGDLYAKERQAAREAQDMEMLQKLMETKGKIADVEQAYKEKKYGVGTGAFKDTYDRAFNSAKEQGLDDRSAKEIAARAVEAEKDRENRLKAARIQAEARVGGAGDKQTLNELRALQTSIAAQLKDPRMMGPKGDPLRQQLQQVNAAIAQMAGIGTMPGAPGAAGPGGNTRMRFDAQGNLIQ